MRCDAETDARLVAGREERSGGETDAPPPWFGCPPAVPSDSRLSESGIGKSKHSNNSFVTQIGAVMLRKYLTKCPPQM